MQPQSTLLPVKIVLFSLAFVLSFGLGMLIAHATGGDSSKAVNVAGGGIAFLGLVLTGIAQTARSDGGTRSVWRDWSTKVGIALSIIGGGLFFGYHLLALPVW